MGVESENFIYIFVEDYPELAKGRVLYEKIHRRDLLEIGKGDYVKINTRGEIRELSKGTIFRDEVMPTIEPDSYPEYLSNNISRDYKGSHIMRVIELALQN